MSPSRAIRRRAVQSLKTPRDERARRTPPGDESVHEARKTLKKDRAIDTRPSPMRAARRERSEARSSGQSHSLAGATARRGDSTDAGNIMAVRGRREQLAR